MRALGIISVIGMAAFSFGLLGYFVTRTDEEGYQPWMPIFAVLVLFLALYWARRLKTRPP